MISQGRNDVTGSMDEAREETNLDSAPTGGGVLLDSYGGVLPFRGPDVLARCSGTAGDEVRIPNLNEPKNPFDERVERAAEAFEYWTAEGNQRMANRMGNIWARLTQKGMYWENAMAVVRNEILDAVAAYEKRVGLG